MTSDSEPVICESALPFVLVVRRGAMIDTAARSTASGTELMGLAAARLANASVSTSKWRRTKKMFHVARILPVDGRGHCSRALEWSLATTVFLCAEAHEAWVALREQQRVASWVLYAFTLMLALAYFARI